MSSTYLLDILGGEGDDLLPDASQKIPEILNEINSLKNDVKNVMEGGTININPYIKESESLKSQAQDLISEMSAVRETIVQQIKPELSGCTIELETMSAKLHEVHMSLDVLNQLLELYSAIKNASRKMKNREFYECSKLVASTREAVKNDNHKLKGLKVLKTLSHEVVVLYEQLLHDVSEIWSSCVSLEVEQLTNSTMIRISIDTSGYDDIEQILKASNCLKDHAIEKKFSAKLMSQILNEIILKEASIIEEEDEKAVLSVTVFQNSKKPSYSKVFENIIKTIQFLKRHLDVEIDHVSFMSRIGQNIGNDFIESLIKNCLSETIPTKSDGLERYKEVVESAEIFQTELQNAGFLPKDCCSLIDYAKNINVLFANKVCQSYLDKARTIMKKDLHNIISSDEIVLDKLDVLPQVHCNILKDKLNRLQNDVIIFPQCQISKSAEEVLNLVTIVMNEVVKSQDLCAVRLFYTIRNIFEMYAAVVPLHHKKFLETLPQQVAIFHNNCMYFAHHLIRLTCEYKKCLPAVLREHFAIFLEEAVLLRSLAAETLELHVSTQRNQLIYILRDSGLATLNEDPKLNPNTEKSVRQCIRQLQILQTVWRDVLPSNVYTKALGFLVDSCIEEITALILSVEDISSDTATELVTIFNVIVNRGPSLFLDPNEIHRHSRKWQRFKELILMLGGSLRDIDARWSDASGPLANEFPAEQVKHLIRALFQNSERRAALLARIK